MLHQIVEAMLCFIFTIWIPVLYQLVEFVPLCSFSIQKKERILLNLIRFSTLIVCYLIMFFFKVWWNYWRILRSLEIPSLFMLVLVFVLTVIYMKPAKSKRIRILLYILSGILLSIICMNNFSIMMSV